MTSSAILTALLSLAVAADKPGDDSAPLLERIKSVKSEGRGNVEARDAWKQLVALGPDALFPTLSAMTERDAVVNNWLRSAVDAVAEKTIAAKKPLPVKELEAFVLDKKHSNLARRAAYEWLVKADAATSARLLPGMLDDPSVEIRRDAVALLVKKADAKAKDDMDEARKDYRRALQSARDGDQVDDLAKKLKGLGVETDIAAHLGYIREWKLLSAFDNVAGVGFHNVYEPEKGVQPGKVYEGKKGEKTTWVDYATKDDHGLVDLNKVLGKLKGSVAYAYVVVESPDERKVQLRAGCINAIKIQLNGKQVFAREEYHHGMSADQHVGFGTLKKGKNEILVKICQNEQTESWAQDWKFQLRLCDELGGAVPFTTVTTKEGTR